MAMDETQDKTVILPRDRGNGEPGKGNALPNGYVLQGRYLIEAQLGAGGFGITYLAKHRYLEDLWVAIKEYLPAGAAVRDSSSRVHAISEQHNKIYSWGLHRFLDEARLLRQFKHPNIVSVEDFFEANETAYMVMNYIHGRSIQADLDAGRKFTEEELRKILYPILDALQLIHRDGLYHRDISPDNVLLREEDDSPVLIDFGSARYEMRMRGGDQGHVPTAIFKQGYSPIEQYEGTPQGPYTDIYALGATLYRTAFGTRPVDALKRSGEIRLANTDPLVPASEKGKGQFSREFLTAIDAALRLEAADRPKSIDAWSRIFGITKQQQAEVATLVMGRPRRPKWPKLLAVAALIAIVSGTLLWYQMRHREELPQDVPSLLARATAELEDSPFDEQTQDRARQIYLEVLNRDRDNARALAGYRAANTLSQFNSILATEDRTTAAVLLDNAEVELDRAGGDRATLAPGWKRIELQQKIAAIRERIAEARLTDDSLKQLEALAAEIGQTPAGQAQAEAMERGIRSLRDAAASAASGRFDEAQTQVVAADESFATLGATGALLAKKDVVDAKARFEAERGARILALLQTAGESMRQLPLTIDSLRTSQSIYEEVLALDETQSEAKAGRAIAEKLIAGLAAMDRGEFEAAANLVTSAQMIAASSDIQQVPLDEARTQVAAAQRRWSLEKLRAEVQRLVLTSAGYLEKDPLDVQAITNAEELYEKARQASEKERELAAEQTVASSGIALVTALREAAELVSQGNFAQAREQLQLANLRALTGAVGLGSRIAAEVDRRIDEDDIRANEEAIDAVFAQAAPLTNDDLEIIERRLDRILTLDGDHSKALTLKEVIRELRASNAARSDRDYESAEQSLTRAQDILAAGGLETEVLARHGEVLEAEALAWESQQREQNIVSLLRYAFTILAEKPFSADSWSTVARVLRAIENIDGGRESAKLGQQVLSNIKQAYGAMEKGDFDSALQSIEAAEHLISNFDGLSLGTARSEITTARRAWEDATENQIIEKLSSAQSILHDQPLDAGSLALAREQLLEVQRVQPHRPAAVAGIRIIGILEEYVQALEGKDFGKAETLLRDADRLARQAEFGASLLTAQETELKQQRREWERAQAMLAMSELAAKAGGAISAAPLDEAHLDTAVRGYRKVIEMNQSAFSDQAVNEQATAGLESVLLLRAFKADEADRKYAALQRTLLELRDRLATAKLDLTIVDRLERIARESEIKWRKQEASSLILHSDWLQSSSFESAEGHLARILELQSADPFAVACLKGIEDIRHLQGAYHKRDYEKATESLNAATKHFSQAGFDEAHSEPIRARLREEQQRWSNLTRDRNLNAWTGAAVRAMNRAPFAPETWESGNRFAGKILAQSKDDIRGLAIKEALKHLRGAKKALDVADFAAARHHVITGSEALEELGLRQPLQRASDLIESAVQQFAATQFTTAGEALREIPVSDDTLVDVQGRMQRVLKVEAANPVALLAVDVIHSLVAARSAIDTLHFAAAERALDRAFDLLKAPSLTDISPLLELEAECRNQQGRLLQSKPSPGELYPIISAALGQIARDPLDTEKLDGAETLLRNVLGMQADEETALSGLQAIGHLRNSTEALANGDLEAAKKEVKAAEELMVDIGLSADVLQSARQAIEGSAR